MSTRIEPLDRGSVPDLEDVFAVKQAILGFVPNSALIMARWPELARAYAALTGAIASAHRLPPGLANLVFLVASNAAGCMYCVAHSAGKAIKQDLPAMKLEAVWEFETSALFDEAERAALRLALAAGVAPPAVTDEHFEQLREHFDDDATIEIVGVIAFSGFMNRWNATLGTPLEAAPRAAAQAHLQGVGWQAGVHDSP